MADHAGVNVMSARGPVTFLEPRHDHDRAGRCEDCRPGCGCGCHGRSDAASGDPKLGLRRLIVERMEGVRIDVLEQRDFEVPPARHLDLYA